MARPGLTQHRKFSRLARAVDSDAMALGCLEFMWEVCYQSGNEYLGDASDVETACRWKGKRGKLFRALLDAGGEGNCGFIDELQDRPGHYRCHDLFDHAPRYVSRRVEREVERQANGVTMSAIRAAAGRKGAEVTNSKRRQLDDKRAANERQFAVTPSPALPSPALKKEKQKLTSSAESADDQFDLKIEDPSTAPNPDQLLADVWSHFIATIAKHPKQFKWTSKRRSMGLARLREAKEKGGSWENAVELLTLCIDRLRQSPWHNGKNPTGTKYLSWEILFRSTEAMERWLDDDRWANDTKGAA